MYNFLQPFDFGRNFFGDFDSDMSNRDRMLEEEKAYTITITIPGFNKDEIELYVEDGVLKLNAENKDRKYTRSYALPDISNEEISAKLENGILIVSIPKREPVKKLIKID